MEKMNSLAPKKIMLFANFNFFSKFTKFHLFNFDRSTVGTSL